MTDFPGPNCPIHERQLNDIESKVDTVLEKVDDLIAHDGPIGALERQVAILDNRSGRIEYDVEKIKQIQWNQLLKASGLTAGFGGIILIVVKILEATLATP